MSNKVGYFGKFGGKFIPETLEYAARQLEQAYKRYQRDPQFLKEVDFYLKEYAHRPTLLYYAKNLSAKLGFNIYFKREDLLHTGAHKINNAIAQGILAQRMGKKRIIAETGAGQHGVAVATVCALFGLSCEIYMGALDIERQKMNVLRMQLLGAKVHPVLSGTQTLKDACSEAMRDWIRNVYDTYYLLGSVIGFHPYPTMVRNFQAVIGREVRRQIIRKEKRLPDVLLACVGAGSNALGLFHPFFYDRAVRCIGVEATGQGVSSRHHAASLMKGKLGILHGAKSYVLQTPSGQIQEAYSIAPGLDYPGVGPEHAFYKEMRRAEYVGVSDVQALLGFRMLSEIEGIIPALESAHAIFYLRVLQKTLKKNSLVVVCLSGRGDKDLHTVGEYREKTRG